MSDSRSAAGLVVQLRRSRHRQSSQRFDASPRPLPEAPRRIDSAFGVRPCGQSCGLVQTSEERKSLLYYYTGGGS